MFIRCHPYLLPNDFTMQVSMACKTMIANSQEIAEKAGIAASGTKARHLHLRRKSNHNSDQHLIIIMLLPVQMQSCYTISTAYTALI
jgi:hypothetical protein